MGITVEFKDFDEMVAFAIQLTGTVPTMQALKGEKTVKAIVERVNKRVGPTAKDEVPTEEETTQDQEQEQGEPEQEEAVTYTLEQVRAKLTELTRSGKQKEVKAILTSVKAANLTSVDPKDYAEVMEKAGKL